MNEKMNNKRIICFGEVLWDMLPKGKKIGGAPLNVAYHLNRMGQDAAIVSRIGKDDLGNGIKEFIQQKELSAASILQLDSTHPTSIVEAKVDDNHEVTYDIVEEVAWDYIDYNKELEQLVDESKYLVFGSLCTRHQVTRQTLRSLLESDLIKILDVNLRPPFYSKEILEKLLSYTQIAKMNEHELKIIAQWFDIEGNTQECISGLAQKFELEILITTFGSKGAYLWHDNEILFQKGHKVEVADTVGSGDAFLAGFLSEYIQDTTIENALKVANTLGAFIATKDGGCPEYEKAEIKI